MTVTLLNDGGEPHQLQLARLSAGASVEELRKDLTDNPAAAFGLITLAGGPDTVEPGGGQRVALHLDSGSYVALDLAVGSDGLQNVSKGMLQPFAVGDAVVTQEPSAEASLGEVSFGYELPPLVAPKTAVTVVNRSDDDAHEAAIVQPLPGRAASDVLAFLAAPSGPPPFRFVGGMAALEPHDTGVLYLELDAGLYVVFCAVTDPRTGRFHFDEGMVQAITVR